ncbi:cytochrome b561 [Aspergillus luchuensis]|uniref:Cytochrome b561 n=1 Tax=Aspergillus kawachii TaxID=1069201 RepID=A0A146FBP4_ASPKA|nr:cytochrome b561 [Aspergillus luchuensis]
MASATGIPQEHPDTIQEQEDAPLLHTPGNVPQEKSAAIYQNLFTGTASAAQVGIWMLLNSAALLLQVQATLILQPTTTPHQKRLGTIIHYIIQTLSLLGFITAFIIIEINKGDHAHFTSPHGILGLITYIFIILQVLVGVVQYFVPVQVLGSVEKGKSIYKYHRKSGYVLLLLELATVSAATQTTYNLNVLSIPLWGVLVASVLVVLGLGARIKKHKLGL